MNILFSHEISYLRDPVWEWHQLAELMSLRGHNICVTDYGSHCYQEMDISRVHNSARIHLVRPPSFGLGRVGYSSYIYNIYIRVIRDRKIDAVILYSAPTNGAQIIAAAKKYRIPVMFRSIDVLHKLVPGWLSGPTKAAERWVYQHADRILTITPALSRYVVSLGAKLDKVGILPLGVDLEYAQDSTGRTLHNFMYENGTKYHLMVFAGTIPHFSGLPELLKRIPEMAARIPIKLLIVGDGAQREELENMILDLNLSRNVLITGMVPHEDVPKLIARADIGVLTFPADGATRDIFPTKVLQYMAARKPVVANPLPGLVEFGLGEEQGVVYVKSGDWGSAVEHAMQNRDMLGGKARRYVEREHGYDRIVSRLEDELEELIR